jgi:hypothetical protein
VKPWPNVDKNELVQGLPVDTAARNGNCSFLRIGPFVAFERVPNNVWLYINAVND